MTSHKPKTQHRSNLQHEESGCAQLSLFSHFCLSVGDVTLFALFVAFCDVIVTMLRLQLLTSTLHTNKTMATFNAFDSPISQK